MTKKIQYTGEKQRNTKKPAERATPMHIKQSEVTLQIKQFESQINKFMKYTKQFNINLKPTMILDTFLFIKQ